MGRLELTIVFVEFYSGLRELLSSSTSLMFSLSPFLFSFHVQLPQPKCFLHRYGLNSLLLEAYYGIEGNLLSTTRTT